MKMDTCKHKMLCGGKQVLKGRLYNARPHSPPEFGLVLACLQAFSGRGGKGRIQALWRSGIDGEAFLNLVDQHRVSAPIYEALSTCRGHGITGSTLQALKERYRSNVRQVLIKTGELVRLVRRFEEKGIRVLPLKGPVLALALYGKVGLRYVGDLDIAVPPGSVSEAEGILKDMGYERTHPAFALTKKQYAAYIRTNHHFGYLSGGGGVNVELHWRFGSNRYLFPLRFDDLWRGREIVELGGTSLASLSPEQNLLFLCTHGAQHAWVRLFWLQDIAHLMRNHHSSFDWERLMGRAGRLGVGRMVAAGVVLANQLLHSPLPGPVQAFAERDRNVHFLVRMALYLMTVPGPVHRPLTRAYGYVKLNGYFLRRDMRYKVAYCLRVLGPSVYDDWRRFPLPDNLFALYSLIRPFTWIFRWFGPGTSVYREGPMGRG